MKSVKEKTFVRVQKKAYHLYCSINPYMSIKELERMENILLEAIKK